MNLETTQIIYRAEGNANLVVNLPEHQKVLRLQKSNVIKTNTTENNKNVLDMDKRVSYMNIINKLFGLSYSFNLEIIQLTTLECNRISELCAPFRPANRLEKEVIAEFGLLMQDASLILDYHLKNDDLNNYLKNKNTIAIEIKPKQGWMIQEIQYKVPNIFQFKDLNKCRFCSQQYLKLKNGKINEISKFCPMDLFSGNPIKMDKALDELFKCPQNNLRIFQNGIQCYGDFKDSISLEKLYTNIFKDKTLIKKLIVACLLNQYKTNFTSMEDNLNNNLPKGCVLHTLLSVQTLARDNIEFMINELNEKEISYNYLPALTKKNIDYTNLKELTFKEKYILGATAMDSSLMITYSEIDNSFKNKLNNSNMNIIEIDNKLYLTQVKILDIDPKSDNHFRKYVKQTNNAYCETFLHMTKEQNLTSEF